MFKSIDDDDDFARFEGGDDPETATPAVAAPTTDHGTEEAKPAEAAPEQQGVTHVTHECKHLKDKQDNACL